MRGTWQTSGEDSGRLLVAVIIVAAVLIGSGAAAIAEALVMIAIVAGCAVVLAVALALVVVPRLARRSDRRDAEVYEALTPSEGPTRPIALTAMVQPPPFRARNCRNRTNRPSSRAASYTCISTGSRPTRLPPSSPAVMPTSRRTSDRRLVSRRHLLQGGAPGGRSTFCLAQWNCALTARRSPGATAFYCAARVPSGCPSAASVMRYGSLMSG